MSNKNICFIGGGNMARGLIGGLIDDNIDPLRIKIGEPDAKRRKELTNCFRVTALADNKAAAEESDIVILAVKPQVMRSVILALAKVLSKKQPLLISIAAGITITSLESWVGGNPAVVRAMPNTPALINSGITALFANPQVSPKQRDLSQSMMRSVGKTLWVEDEALIDTVTSVSGSGPAYFFYLIEALEQAAIDGGLNEDTARLLTLETALGAARLALESNHSPSELRKQVTSPGGTTQAAIQVLDHAGATDILKRAVNAARKRSAELAITHANN